MDEKDLKHFLENVEAIIEDFATHSCSCNREIFGDITVKDLGQLSKQMIVDYGFNTDHYYNIWNEIWNAEQD